LEGGLDELRYGDLRGRISREIESWVRVEIEFTESQEIDDRAEGERQAYIGRIHLNDCRSKDKPDGGLNAIVRIRLPLTMFHQLKLMEGKLITFDTIHDLIENPSEEQKQDHIIAFVKRAYFDTTTEFETETEKKTRGVKRR